MVFFDGKFEGVIIDTGDSQAMSSAISCVCAIVWVCLSFFLSLCVRTVIGKQLELSTPDTINIQCMTVGRHALTLRSKVKVTCSCRGI